MVTEIGGMCVAERYEGAFVGAKSASVRSGGPTGRDEWGYPIAWSVWVCVVGGGGVSADIIESI